MPRPFVPAACLIAIAFALSCTPQGGEAVTPESTQAQAPDTQPGDSTAQERFWAQLQQLCGNAYAGALVSNDEADQALVGQPMTMHVRRCAENRIEIPFHIDTDHSRTWVLTRTPEGLHLQHDHRHEDGTADEVTLYGGVAKDDGTEQKQFFPADTYSKELFERSGLEASRENVWSFELVPDERFSYILRRPERHFQADFDLGTPVAAPPPPWGHEPLEE